MTIPILRLSIDDARSAYQPGDTLAASYHVEAAEGGAPQALELSVLWRTEGKGDEDMAVHFFERMTADEAAHVDFRQPRLFSTVLPGAPLSYDGVILKIRWCVRLRAFLPRGKQLVEECPFRLGNIPAARAILP